MKNALASLTFRGKGFLAVGAGIAVGAAFAGQRDLLRIAVLLLVLPFLAAYLAGRTRFRLGCERLVRPSQIPVGTLAEVDLAITNLSPVRTGTLLLRDAVPDELGFPVHRVLERVEPSGTRTTTYPLRAYQRGRYEIGPLSVTAVDPFGLVRLTRSFRATEPVLVVPRVIALPDSGLRADHRGRGDGRSLSLAARGQDDVVPREYRFGDDLRRIHWRASARAGELMVRREEQPWTHQATVVVDLRQRAHGGDGPDSSLELALSVAASAALHLLRRGWHVRVVGSDGLTMVASAFGPDGETRVLEALALAEPSSRMDWDPGTVRADLVVAVAAADRRVTPPLTGSGSRTAGQLGLLFLVDAVAWGAVDAVPARELERDLAEAGWHVAVLGPQDDVAAAWHAVTADADERVTR